MVFIGEQSSKRRVNAYMPKYISMACYIMFLWIPRRYGPRSKVTGNFLVNALHVFHRFNRRYRVEIIFHNEKQIYIIYLELHSNPNDDISAHVMMKDLQRKKF